MKLYATITSERASKGQGGNKEINIDLIVGSRDKSIKLAEISLTREKDGYNLYASTVLGTDEEQCIDYFVNDDELIQSQKGDRLFQDQENIKSQELQDIKGEKQKGKVCSVCGGQDIEGCSYCNTEGNE